MYLPLCFFDFGFFYKYMHKTLKRKKILFNNIIMLDNCDSTYYVIIDMFTSLNLSYDEGGHIVPPKSVFIFLPKISPPDQTHL